ncbi:SHIPPO 1-like protein [Spironucleus salmonicida]|uniref:SHIPPO 1-like protein n=1 Tax=Spironucleus salmonicida TaxID=348837 RepID=V6LJJ5_9EUKA|nr:SHIPPO 1-like protein [Spironucleus salmonicida]|eukprot:EST44553.1 SHIPPO 1-like protein [Spironucleus salmonicida]
MQQSLVLSNCQHDQQSNQYHSSSLLCSRTVLDDCVEGSFTPGVGSYNIRSGSKLVYEQAPAFTIKGKYSDKQIQRTVGPGDYNTRKSISALEHIPGGQMNKQDRFRRNTSITPGPGQYEYSRSIIHSQGQSMSFRHKIAKDNANPGPNQYTLTQSQPLRGSSISGRHDSFQNIFRLGISGGPGPGQYTPKFESSFKNSNPSFPRAGLVPKTTQSQLVGPGKYDIQKGFNFNKKKTGGTGFTFGSRNKGHTF